MILPVLGLAAVFLTWFGWSLFLARARRQAYHLALFETVAATMLASLLFGGGIFLPFADFADIAGPLALLKGAAAYAALMAVFWLPVISLSAYRHHRQQP